MLIRVKLQINRLREVLSIIHYETEANAMQETEITAR